ncbi:hypothetical protein [Sphingobacterium bambusae]|uniref:DUF3108 domain-containing protein n=1 Tax=Sphingobacterium bambusae TaxID=662858 RepID=A0ABW6BA23_9SPHI|nr:hypothetical protein [Sphingobacterium bambusae]WPL49161.1 hypothetical protein SCB77_01610 [Sphingobacterium bambusae]
MRTKHTQKPMFATRMAMGIGSLFLFAAILSLPLQGHCSTSVSDLMLHKHRMETGNGLEEFLGIYQLPNKIAFISFTLDGDSLLATQLWDNKKYRLSQIDEVTFETKEDGQQVVFQKDSFGMYNKATLLGRIATVKVAFDPRVVQQLTIEQLKKYQGTYVLQDDGQFEIEIRSSATGLILKQLWDNKEIHFSARSETFFLSKDHSFPLTFLLKGTQAIQVTCFADDIWKKVSQ